MVKFKNRYFLAQVVIDSTLGQVKTDFSTSEIFHAIWDVLGSIHGDYGAGACKTLQVKVFNEKTRIVLIRIGRAESQLVLSTMPFVLKIGRTPATLRTVHIGASVRSCEKALLRFHKLHILTSLPKARTLEEKKTVMAALRETSVRK